MTLAAPHKDGTRHTPQASPARTGSKAGIRSETTAPGAATHHIVGRPNERREALVGLEEV